MSITARLTDILVTTFAALPGPGSTTVTAISFAVAGLSAIAAYLMRPSSHLWLMDVDTANCSRRTVVRGLHNPANLCFLNSTLQALAACPSFVFFVDASATTAAVDAAGRGVEEGSNGSSLQPEAPGPAGAPRMLAALAAIMAALAPRLVETGTPPPADGKLVLREMGGSQLRDGEQQDAGEALQLICSIISCELSHWFQAHRAPAIHLSTTLEDILLPPTSSGPAPAASMYQGSAPSLSPSPLGARGDGTQASGGGSGIGSTPPADTDTVQRPFTNAGEPPDDCEGSQLYGSADMAGAGRERDDCDREHAGELGQQLQHGWKKAAFPGGLGIEGESAASPLGGQAAGTKRRRRKKGKKSRAGGHEKSIGMVQPLSPESKGGPRSRGAERGEATEPSAKVSSRVAGQLPRSGKNTEADAAGATGSLEVALLGATPCYGRAPPGGSGPSMLLLQEWRRLTVSPLQGCTAQMITCLSCSSPSLTQVNPFTVLYLTPPSSGGVVVRGTALEDCLAEFVAPDIVSDRTCPSCSHRATLDTLAPLEANSEKEPQQEQSNSTVQKLLRKVHACKGRIDDCDCPDAVAAAGLPWVKAARPASKCTKVAMLPQVLCLNLRRVDMLMTGQSVKVAGHVRFPLVLDMRDFCNVSLAGATPTRGSGFGSSALARMFGVPAGTMEDGDGSLRLAGANPAPRRCHYHLRAVVQHHGGPTSGHYTAYRWCHAPGSPGGCWKLVSDTKVHDVSVEQVLGSEATMLMYERSHQS